MTTLPEKNVKYQEETRVPIDKPDSQIDPTNRRTFLARAAMGGALVAVSTVGPLGHLLPAAAQADADGPAEGTLDDDATGQALAPAEVAAVAAYEAALNGGKLDAAWAEVARQFQRHHLEASVTLTSLIESGTTPAADPTITTGTIGAIGGAGDQTAVLLALSEMESVIAATHLWALGGIADKSTAKTISQYLAVESQQAVFLGRTAGTDLATLTPAVVAPAPTGPTPPTPATEETGN